MSFSKFEGKTKANTLKGIMLIYSIDFTVEPETTCNLYLNLKGELIVSTSKNNGGSKTLQVLKNFETDSLIGPNLVKLSGTLNHGSRTTFYQFTPYKE